ncbi:Pr6Pr family membrane protein [Plantibacter sp. YIM 135347]|uniref:Pr6Pr family membrane protein n=1 Tax=Plantibacter sp. YIM 135347 TaxID=3423919 RepID=UPI003D333126
MIGLVPNRTLARIWHTATAILVLLSVGAQLLLVIGNVNIGFGPSNAPLAQRLVEFFSYFTIESNLLVGVAAGMLAARPDRDGAVWRVLRIGSMFGITVTLIIYHVLLAPLAAFTGVAAVSNIGLHYVVPVVAILGWILFGPHPSVTWRALFFAAIWPASYIVLTVIQGAITGFYPYPFVNITELGFVTVALNGVGVVLLLLAVGTVYLLADRLITRAQRPTLQRETSPV